MKKSCFHQKKPGFWQWYTTTAAMAGNTFAVGASRSRVEEARASCVANES